MSRFTVSRRNQIMVWTGAALAWGTAFVAGKVEPVRSADQLADANVEPSTTKAAIPDAPINGLVILRYTPIERPLPEVKYIYVKQVQPSSPKSSSVAQAGSGGQASPPPPPPASTSAPNPPSSGS